MLGPSLLVIHAGNMVFPRPVALATVSRAASETAAGAAAGEDTISGSFSPLFVPAEPAEEDEELERGGPARLGPSLLVIQAGRIVEPRPLPRATADTGPWLAIFGLTSRDSGASDCGASFSS